MWKILQRINKNLVCAAWFSRGLPDDYHPEYPASQAGITPKLQGTAQFITFALSTLTATLFFTRNDGIALACGTVIGNLSSGKII
ncbi:hypothetical protein [Desulfocastanea catecholica]